MKPNKENIIQNILIELEKGVTYNDCLVLFGTKWNLPKTTFTRYWNKANEAYKEVLNRRQTELNVLSTDLEKERLKTAILTKYERLMIAQGIAQGKARKIGDQILIPSDGDRIRALDFIAKVEGDYVASKIDATIKGADEIIIKKKSDS